MTDHTNHPKLEGLADSATRSSAGEDWLQPAAEMSQLAPVSGSEPFLLSCLKVIHKRRWTGVTVLVLVTVAVAISTFTTVPTYEARVQLLIEPESPSIVEFKEVVEQNKATLDYYQTQYRMLQSRSLAVRTINALELWKDPEFARAPQPSGFSVSGTVNGLWSWLVALIRRPVVEAQPDAAAAAASETAEQSRVASAFLGRITVSPIRNSRLVDVRFESANPELAARAANGLAKAYIEQNLEFRFTASKEANTWLNERMVDQRRKVEESEVALQRYRETNDAVSLEERQNIVVQKLTELNTAVTRAKLERIQKEASYNQLRAAEKDPKSLDTFPAILSNGFIQQLKGELSDLQREGQRLSEQLGDRHPKMVNFQTQIRTAEARLQAEIGKIVQSMHTEYEAAVAQERGLIAALDAQKREALDLNRKDIDYSVLQREASGNREMYDSLMQRAKETGVSGELRTSNVRVVDPAEVPAAPVKPNRRMNLLMGLFAGTVLALGLIGFFEYLDNRIKTPEDVADQLGVPYLGMVPLIPRQSANGYVPLLTQDAAPSFVEAFRTVRTSVLFASADEGARALVVTSTRPGEGKTVVSCNLAIALAQAGSRVLLIDGDMRSPKLHLLFDLEREPGLSNVLVNKVKPAEAVRTSGVPGLWIMTAGLHPPNPPELLGSARFRDFLTALKQHFDWVIIDSPPVLAVTDAVVTAHVATGVLFVAGADMTPKDAGRLAVQRLAGSRARILGAVLNRVDLEHNHYYYSRYYRPEYERYYVAAKRA